MRPDKNWLNDILDAADEIAYLIQGLDMASFVANRHTRGSVQLQLLFVGEAVAQLSDGFKSNHAAVAWKQIAGYRNTCIHAYFKTDWDIIWITASIHAPVIRNAVAEIIKIEFST